MTASHSVIAVRGLNFGYHRDQPILRDLQLTVPPGAIYGFLGANGSGKSTTIRAILGLLKPQGGDISLFETPVAGHRRALHRRIGSLIESPSLYPHLSGFDNLKIAATYWDLPRDRIAPVLEEVGLDHAAGKLVRQYSMGMKQRLGLAIALLPDPDLLILDEPTNGLDPSGIQEIRQTLHTLNTRGKTILLSSHLLGEIEKIATQVGILQDGRMVFEGTIGALEQLRMRNRFVHIQTPAAERTAALFSTRYAAERTDAAGVRLQVDDREQLPGIVRELVAAGIDLYEISAQKNDLEKLFLDLTTQ